MMLNVIAKHKYTDQPHCYALWIWHCAKNLLGYVVSLKYSPYIDKQLNMHSAVVDLAEKGFLIQLKIPVVSPI